MGQKNRNDTKSIEDLLAEEADKLQESIRYYGRSQKDGLSSRTCYWWSS